MNKDDTGNWHLDRRVPISLILAIIIQTGTFIWFFSKMDSRIQSLETAVTAQRDRDDRQDSVARDGLNNLRSDVKEVDRKLDRLIERATK